jgi:hypothetical protein
MVWSPILNVLEQITRFLLKSEAQLI